MVGELHGPYCITYDENNLFCDSADNRHLLSFVKYQFSHWMNAIINPCVSNLTGKAYKRLSFYYGSVRKCMKMLLKGKEVRKKGMEIRQLCDLKSVGNNYNMEIECIRPEYALWM